MLFADLKVGDVVAYGHALYRAEVTRVTATQFDAGGYTFSRKDGTRRGGTTMHTVRALPLTDPSVVERLARKALEKRIERAVAALPSANPEVLQQVLALLGV